MPTATRTFRVFVSSTFEDLKEERNALQREVFPRLRELCLAHGCRFQAIDLRWGVRDEAALDQRTMEICLTEIERCQRTGIKPNFIVLLGDRYGWRPLPARIKADEFRRVRDAIADSHARELVENWYQRDDNAVPPEYLLKPRTGEFVDAEQWREIESVLHPALREAARNASLAPNNLIKYEASATHQEILKGLGKEPEDHEHVFAFFRSGAEDEDQDTNLQKLKEDLQEQLHENVFSFDAGDYGELCKRVTESLEKIILDEVERFESRPALDLEIDAHGTFAQGRSKHFVGRKSTLGEIDDYLKGDDRRPMVIHGASGSGKSAIMAKASDARGAFRRFIGATPESSNGLTLLRSLCQEIARRYGQPEDAPATFNELAVTFRDRIELATPDRPLVLFIDALDQLGPEDPAAAMNWLPTELPANCKVITSTTIVPPALQGARLVPVGPFQVEEAEETLKLWFEEANRKLQREQRKKLMATFRNTPLPLYLKLAFEEAKLWRSFDPVEQCVLGEGLEGIVDQLFSRLKAESNHGGVLVGHALGYLAAARYGLTEDEILAVLSDNEDLWNDFRSRAKHEPPERRLPVIVWSRLYFDLEPYLTERAAPGGVVISFYHRQLSERVSTSAVDHAGLARYFAGQLLWLGPQHPNERKVTELVRQQVKAELLDDAVGTLTQIKYLEAKCAAELVFDLQEDYREAIMALPEAQEELREEERHKAEAARWTKEIIEYARQWSERRNRLERGERVTDPVPLLPCVIASVEPWTDDRIAAECRRITENPTRLDRLREFAGFVESECYPLLEFGKRPGFVVQHALNREPGGTVNAAADQEADSAEVPMLIRRWPLGTSYNSKPSLLRTLEGHSDFVNSVSVTPNGRRAVSASRDKTLRVWDLETGRCERTLEGHSNEVYSVSVTPDGRRAVSGSWDKTLRVWDLETGRCERTLEGHSNWVYSVSVTPDGRRAISASYDNTLRVWDLEFGRCERTLEGHSDWIESVSVTPDGRRAVSGSRDKTLRVWDLETGRCEQTLEGHGDFVMSVSLTPDGQRAVSGSHRMLRVWDLKTGRCERTMEGHNDWVVSVSVTPDGRKAVSGGRDMTLRAWDLETGRCERTLEGHSGWVESVSVTPDGRRAVSASGDETLRFWNLETGCNERRIEAHVGQVESVSVTPDGRRAVSGGWDKTLRVWDLETGRCERTLKGHSESVTSVSVTPDGRRAVSASIDKTLRIWDLETGRCERTLEGHGDSVWSVSVMPDGQRAVSASADETLRVWDLETGRCERTLEGTSTEFSTMSVLPDGSQAVSAIHSSLRFWNLEIGGCWGIMEVEGHELSLESSIHSMVLTPDGRRVVAASSGGRLWVWHLATEEESTVFRGHSETVHSLSVTPDGKRAVCASSDKTLRVWDLDTGRCLTVVRGNAEWISVSALSANRIIGGTSLGDVDFFDLRSVEAGPAICTAVRNSDALTQRIALCSWCSYEMQVPQDVVKAINEHQTQLKPNQSPCLDLPESAFRDPRLRATCLHCGKPLQFNPFFVEMNSLLGPV